MTAFKSDFLRTLEARGYIHQGTNLEGLDDLASREVVTGYIGFDATAPSLHAGSLLQIMLLRRLQEAGHKPIVLMGGGTTKVGDPSGKDQQRALLSDAQIQANIDGIKSVFEKFLTFGDGPTDAILVDNADWLDKLGYVEFLREYGTHFTINRMLTFDSVKLRLDRESPLTFLEFNYMLMQAYDFHELLRRNNCRLQLGGSDQWGNIVNGVELCRRKDSVEVFGVTSPLLTTASGKKMGKTEDGAVWLNADMLSPYDYWQYWRNAEDGDVGRFLRLFTDLPLSEIARLEALKDAEINEAKIVLATEATAMLHGRDEAARAQEAARRTFAEGGASQDLPTVTVSAADIGAGVSVAATLTAIGFTASNGEAKRLIKSNAVKLNDAPVADVGRMLSADDFASGPAKISAGKKKHGLIKKADQA